MMKSKLFKIVSVLSCLLVITLVSCAVASADVKTTTSGVHTSTKVGTDGVTYMTVAKDPGPQITIDETKITGTQDYIFNGEKIGITNWYVLFEGYLSQVDTANKCIYINYGGTLNGMEDTTFLKEKGFKIINPDGKEICFWSSKKPNTLRIPYEDISFVKEMYMTLGDQKVKMTVA